MEKLDTSAIEGKVIKCVPTIDQMWLLKTDGLQNLVSIGLPPKTKGIQTC